MRSVWTAPNTSNGFHDELFAMWDAHAASAIDVLLVGEGRRTKEHFAEAYPHWRITTVNFDAALQPDILVDMCCSGWIRPDQYDIAINQANLEHVYDPFGLCREVTIGLRNGGIHCLHTHTQGVMYHPWPRDYLRFERDWFEDLPSHVGMGLTLLELVITDRHDIFAKYVKIH